jgi:hypothetical protein
VSDIQEELHVVYFNFLTSDNPPEPMYVGQRSHKQNSTPWICTFTSTLGPSTWVVVRTFSRVL